MTIKTTICDCCKASDAKQVTYFVERKMDAAGSMGNEYEYLDLCSVCMAELLSSLLGYRATRLDVPHYLPIVRGFRKQP